MNVWSDHDRLLLVFVVRHCLVSLVLASASCCPGQVDITGEWVFDVQTDQGGGSPSFVFKQTGEKLTGKYKGAFGEADLTGTVTGKTMKFSFSADAQGTPSP